MKHILFTFALCSIFFSCDPDKSQTDSDQSPLVFKEFPLEIPEENALMTRWEEKKVIKKKMLHN